MFKAFLSEHSFTEYTFHRDFFPTAEDRAFWGSAIGDELVARAAAELEYGWPIIKATDFMAFKGRGDREIMEKPHFDRRHHLTLFVLAELKESKGRFLPQIVNGLFTICEESYWGVSAHWLCSAETKNIPTPAEPYIDLFAAETAGQLVMIAALLQKQLQDFCPEILDRIDYELERRIKELYLLRRDY